MSLTTCPVQQYPSAIVSRSQKSSAAPVHPSLANPRAHTKSVLQKKLCARGFTSGRCTGTAGLFCGRGTVARGHEGAPRALSLVYISGTQIYGRCNIWAPQYTLIFSLYFPSNSLFILNQFLSPPKPLLPPPHATAPPPTPARKMSPPPHGVSCMTAIIYINKKNMGNDRQVIYAGACWAFSAVAAIESINQIKSGKLVSLSEQELIDCDVTGEDQGCGGGLMDTAFKFIVDNHGINSEANYPYKGDDGSCDSKKASVSAVKISGFEDVPKNSEAALLKAVTAQPVSVAIDGGDPNFQSYAGGIFTGPCDTELDHAVTAVGYGTDAGGTKYWVVKNSWGATWGNNGYIKMARDISSAEGLCGLAKQASYPTIN